MKMKIKRTRMLGILLSIALVFGLMPGMGRTAEADDAQHYNVWVGNPEVTSENATDVFGDSKVSYTPATNTLTLNGYTNENAVHTFETVEGGDTINVSTMIYATEDLKIALQGNNTVHISGNSGNISVFGVVVNGNLTIEGSGWVRQIIKKMKDSIL